MIFYKESRHEDQFLNTLEINLHFLTKRLHLKYVDRYFKFR